MLETIAAALVAVIISAAPVNSVLPENYEGYSEYIAYIEQAYENSSYIYTPNGSQVEVFYKDDDVNENNIDKYTYYFVGNEDINVAAIYSGYYKNFEGISVTLKDKNIWRKGDPTSVYNYLSYAFYMYWEPMYETSLYTEIACIMNNYSPYLTDGSFIAVDEPQANDVVLYMNGSRALTAGIIQEVYGSEASNPSSNTLVAKELSRLKVRTKWDKFGVYEHRGDYSPYMPGYASSEVTDIATSSVKYYRRHIGHNYKVVDKTTTTHTYKCFCGDTKQENHNLTYKSTNASYNSASCECGYTRLQESHAWEMYIDPSKPGVNYVRCISCNYTRKLLPGEIIPGIITKKRDPEI